MNTITAIAGAKPAYRARMKENSGDIQQVPVISTEQQADSFTPSFKAGLKTNPVKKSLKAVVAAAMLAVGAAGFQSCKPQPFSVTYFHEGITTVNVNIDMEALADLLGDRFSAITQEQTQALIAAMNQLMQLFTTHSEMTREQLQQIIAQLNSLGLQMGDIVTLLTNQGVKIDQIIQFLRDNNQTLGDLANGQNDIRDLLIQLNDKVETGNHQRQDQIDLETQILQVILSIRTESGQDRANLINLVNIILNKLGNIENLSQQEVNLSSAIYDEIAALRREQGDRYDAHLAMLQNFEAHLNNIETQEAAQTRLQRQILAMMRAWRTESNAHNAQMENDINTIINNLGNIPNAIANSMADVIAAINAHDANTSSQAQNAQQMRQQTYDLIASLANNFTNASSQMIGLGQDIYNLMLLMNSNMPHIGASDYNSKLDQIITLLGRDYTPILESIAEKQDLTNLLIGGVRNAIDASGAQNHADLMAILDAINCNDCCDRIIELLEDIVEDLRNGDNNHEGIRDDFDDILD